MKNISVERLVLGGFITATVVLVLLGCIAWSSALKSDEALGQVMRTHQVLTSVGQIVFNLTRAETAQRDYEIYGENYYLKRRDKSLLNIVRAVDEAERHIVVPEQQEQLRQLKKLIVRRMGNYPLSHDETHDHFTVLPKEGKQVADFFLRNGDGGKASLRKILNNARNSNNLIMDAGSDSSFLSLEQIHHAIGQIVEMESATLSEREAENAFQHKVERTSFSLLGMFLLLLLFFLFLHIRRAMRLSRDEATRLKSCKLQLEEASRNKSNFLAHMSHELRTPINAIMGFSGLLKAEQLGKLTKAQAEYVSDIFSSGEHMLSLVNNILDLSKIEAGKMTLDLEPVEMPVLLDGAISIIRGQAASRHMRLCLDVQPGLDDIQVDPLKTRQILYNLLSNAVKFTPVDGQLKLRARRVPRADVGKMSGRCPSRLFPLAGSEFMEFLEISVADSGPGIPRDGLERLFQSYSRIGSVSTHKSEGTGLGLMLVKHLAELHGGTVAVESAEGQGSLFIVWLPLRTDVGAASEPKELITSEIIVKSRKICTKVLLDLARQRTDFSPYGWWHIGVMAHPERMWASLNTIGKSCGLKDARTDNILPALPGISTASSRQGYPS